jgi:8-oxo-dGTP pyrophosphatase MutT (NUDIX family)
MSTQGQEGFVNHPHRRVASVLVPVFRDAETQIRAVFVIRGASGVHGGQLAFPGGKKDLADETLLETAIRESEEEIGLTRSQITVLAELDPHDTLTTGFTVHPFLARITESVDLKPRPGEIEGIVTPLVKAVCDPSVRREEPFWFPTWTEPVMIPCVPVEGGPLLWGLTLRLVDVIFPQLLAGRWPV